MAKTDECAPKKGKGKMPAAGAGKSRWSAIAAEMMQGRAKNPVPPMPRAKK